jgi:hypothetical protein
MFVSVISDSRHFVKFQNNKDIIICWICFFVKEFLYIFLVYCVMLQLVVDETLSKL